MVKSNHFYEQVVWFFWILPLSSWHHWFTIHESHDNRTASLQPTTLAGTPTTWRTWATPCTAPFLSSHCEKMCSSCYIYVQITLWHDYILQMIIFCIKMGPLMIFPGGTWVATSLGWTVVLAAVAAATLEEPRSTTVFKTSLLPLCF